MNKWRWIFVITLIVLIYFGLGVAQQGQNLGFFVGLFSGTLIVYLFFRARNEAIANANTNINSQSVNVNVSQGRLAQVDEVDLTEDELIEIGRVVYRARNNKLLLSNTDMALDAPQEPLTQSERLAQLLRARRQGQNNV